MIRKPFLAAVFTLAIVSGCNGCFGCVSPASDPNTTIPTSCTTDPPVIQPQQLDILFVIDNSNSMRANQASVARELPAFITEIKKTGGVRQDFNVGVITTSVYRHSLVNGRDWWVEFPGAGLLRPVPDELPDGGLVLETQNERILNGDDPQLAEKFGRLVRQGTFGSGQETPLEAIRLALLTNLATIPVADGGNGGFLRDGARLLIVVVTDEDDCSETARPSKVTVSDDTSVDDCLVQTNSLTPINDYYTMFTQQLGDGLGSKRELIWTAIAPVGISTKAAQTILDSTVPPSGQVRNIDCPTSQAPGFRHRALAEAFDPTLTNLDSICRDGYRETLIHIAELAGVGQTITLDKVPDVRMLQLQIIRKDGTKTTCTAANAGFDVLDPGGCDAAGACKPTKVRFQGECRRRADDQAIHVLMLCAI